MEAVATGGARYATYRYGITNFAFTGVEYVKAARAPDGKYAGRLVLPLNLDGPSGQVTVQVVPHDDYQTTMEHLSLYKTVRVTCEACCASHPNQLHINTDSVIGALCNVASVARGTRIVWLYRFAYDEHNRLVGMLHLSGWVGRYFPLAIFDDGPTHRVEAKRFIESAYPIFVEHDHGFELGSNLIESYLSAKAEGDLLARRGVKLAVALEILKHLYLKRPGCSVRETILSKPVFERIVRKSLREAIANALRSQNVEDAKVAAICDKSNELNRTSFRDVLASLFESIGFRPSDMETSLFISQRNALVHTGRFYTNPRLGWEAMYFDNCAGESRPADGDLCVAGYFFMVNFLDRFFLKFFGYKGSYMNCKVKSVTSRSTGHLDTVE